MTKHESREIAKLTQYATLGADTGMIARSLSALIRATRSNKTRDALLTLALAWRVASHEEFIL